MSPPVPQPNEQETLVLVEDNAMVRRSMEATLRGNGYRVIAVDSGRRCIETVEGLADPVALLITDVVMPEMNGRDLARHVVSLNPRTKHLFMSGYTADIIAHHGVFDEGAPFIEKPFSAAELAIKVSEALKGESAA